jgi:hypothetical protein
MMSIGICDGGDVRGLVERRAIDLSLCLQPLAVESFRNAPTQVHAPQDIRARCGAASVMSELCLAVLPPYRVRPVEPRTKIPGKLGPMPSDYVR